MKHLLFFSVYVWVSFLELNVTSGYVSLWITHIFLRNWNSLQLLQYYLQYIKQRLRITYMPKNWIFTVILKIAEIPAVFKSFLWTVPAGTVQLLAF